MAWEYVVPAVFVLLGICVVLYQRRKRKKAEKVAAGIECYDENGTLTLKTSFLLTYMIGIAETGANDGHITNDLLSGKNFWIAVISHGSTSSWARGWTMPKFTLDGNTLSWKHIGTNFSENVNVVFAYGVD